MLRIFGVRAALLCLAFLSSAFAALASPAYELPRSSVIDVEYQGRAYQLYVSTPPGYSRPENRSHNYPTIYLNDGDLFFASASGAPLLSYYNQSMEESILVGVSYAIGENPITSRQRDFTPVRDLKVGEDTGGGAAYLGAFKSTIIPAIEASFRSDPSRRTLAGHSFGAVFGTYVLLTEPDLFENYILISPSFWYGDYVMAKYESTYSKSHKELSARVFMAVGDLEGPAGGLLNLDMVEDERAFAARLRSRNYEGFILRDEVIPGGVNHAIAFPTSYLRALQWMFPPVPAQ